MSYTSTGVVLIADPSAAASGTGGALAGVPSSTATTWLSQAQGALNALLTTGQPTTVTYGSGDGQKTVTYSRVNEGALRNWIKQLQQALGLGPGRRPLVPGF